MYEGIDVNSSALTASRRSFDGEMEGAPEEAEEGLSDLVDPDFFAEAGLLCMQQK
jgi:hypothetical protein